MAKNELNDNDDRPLNSYAKYSGLGFQMIAIIGMFTYAGYKIDEAAHHDIQWVTAMLSLIGVFISLYIVFRSVKNN